MNPIPNEISPLTHETLTDGCGGTDTEEAEPGGLQVQGEHSKTVHMYMHYMSKHWLW